MAYFQAKKIPIWVNFGGFFNLVYLIVIWYIFPVFCTEENLATLVVNGGTLLSVAISRLVSCHVEMKQGQQQQQLRSTLITRTILSDSISEFPSQKIKPISLWCLEQGCQIISLSKRNVKGPQTAPKTSTHHTK
jgi:hypothetical protein